MEWRRELAQEHSGLRAYLVLGVCLRNDFLRSPDGSRLAAILASCAVQRYNHSHASGRCP